MLKQFVKLASATAVAAMVTALPARADSDTAELLHDANRVVTHMRHDPAFKEARDMLDGARAVYIVPKLVKGGFIFGAEGGDGVLLRRTGHGWSSPKFYGMGSGSFGLQIGLEQAELVFIINSDRALRGIEGGNFKIGANAGVTVVTTVTDLTMGGLFCGSQAALTFSSVVILLCTVALCACFLPALRAVRLDPTVALRNE